MDEIGYKLYYNNTFSDCPICLNVLQYAVVLPDCGHRFCYLCLKGLKTPRCALCRAPFILQNIDTKLLAYSEVPVTEEHEWLYKGIYGWWKYDLRTAEDIEEAYQKKSPIVDILVAGNIYTIDFENMIQIQKSDARRCRKIRRQKPSDNVSHKGIAGLHLTSRIASATP